MIKLQVNKNHKNIKANLIKASFFMITGTIGISLYIPSYKKIKDSYREESLISVSKEVQNSIYQNNDIPSNNSYNTTIIDKNGNTFYNEEDNKFDLNLTKDNLSNVKTLYIDAKDIDNLNFLYYCPSLTNLNIINASCLTKEDYNQLSYLTNCYINLTYPLDYLLANPTFSLDEYITNQNHIKINLTDYVQPAENDIANYIKYSFLKKSNATDEIINTNFDEKTHQEVSIWYNKINETLDNMQLSNNLTEEEQEYILENFVSRSIIYDENYTEEEKHNYNVHSLGAILTTNKDMIGLCTNYSEYLDALNYEKGIESHTIINPDINHAYNIVNIDDNYKIVDSTNDIILDPNEPIYVNDIYYTASDYFGDSPIDNIDKIYHPNNNKSDNIEYINQDLAYIKQYLLTEKEYNELWNKITLGKNITKIDTSLLFIYIIKEKIIKNLKKKKEKLTK